MRKRFEPTLDFGQTPIHLVKLPLDSRDELPPVLRALQWIHSQPVLLDKVLDVIEKVVLGDKQPDVGRPGMDHWHILCLGVIRMALDADYDRLEYQANTDYLLRQILGVPVFAVSEPQTFPHRTISNNLCLLEGAPLQKINDLLVTHGLPLLQRRGEKIQARTDSFVVETNVHYPTDANLLLDAGRKVIELVSRACETAGVNGWRKADDWHSRLKAEVRVFEKTASGGGPNKQDRVKKTAQELLQTANLLASKAETSLAALDALAGDRSLSLISDMLSAREFLVHLRRQADQLRRRVLQGEVIPHAEKEFSLFEPHTRLVKKGKVMPPVEFGRRLLVTSCRQGLVLDYKIMGDEAETGEALPAAKRLVAKQGAENIASLSFDKGFSSDDNITKLQELLPEVEIVMPRKGKKNATEATAERQPTFVRGRRRHNAVESDINCLEHHGLSRCRDKKMRGFERCIGLGVMAYNLHKIGEHLLVQDRREQKKREEKARRQARRDRQGRAAAPAALAA